MTKKLKFGNTKNVISISVKVAIAIVIGVVLYIVLKAVLDFAKDPAKYVIDFFDNFLNDALAGLRACGTCKPSANQTKEDPTTTNICGGTGIPFLNGNCLGGIIIFAVIIAFVLGAIKKAYNYFTGNKNEKLSDIYKRTSGKDFKTFKDQLDQEQKSVEKDYDDAYEKWRKDKPDTPENKKAFEKEYADQFRNKQTDPAVKAKLKNIPDEDLIKIIKSQKMESSMRDFTTNQSKSGSADPAATAKSKAYTRSAAKKSINDGLDEEAEKISDDEFDAMADEAESFEFEV